MRILSLPAITVKLGPQGRDKKALIRGIGYYILSILTGIFELLIGIFMVSTLFFKVLRKIFSLAFLAFAVLLVIYLPKSNSSRKPPSLDVGMKWLPICYNITTGIVP